MTEIRCTRAVLRPTTPGNLLDLLRLWNNSRVMCWVGFSNDLGYDQAKIESWFERLQADPCRHHCVVLSPEISFCNRVYYAADPSRRRASLDIKLLPEAQAQDFAVGALSTLTSYIFKTEPYIHVVWTEPTEQNLAARRLYTRCGLQSRPRPADLGPFESFWKLSRDEH